MPKKWMWLLFLVCLLCGCAQEEEELPVSEVVATHPFDQTIFTQGLEVKDGDLLVSGGQYGDSFAGRYRPDEHALVQRVDLDERFFAEGLTVSEDRVLQLTWREQTLFVRDPETLEVIDTVSYPGEGWGIAMGEDTVFFSDGTTDIRRLDPETLEETGRFTVEEDGQPVSLLNELEYVDGKLYANIWQTDDIVRIDPDTGKVERRYTFTGLLSPEEKEHADVLNGIAHIEDDRFYITGKWWPKLFEVILR